MRRGFLARPRILLLVVAAYGVSLWGAAIHRAWHAGAAAARSGSALACGHAQGSIHLCASARAAEAHPPDCVLCATGSGRFGVHVDLSDNASRALPAAFHILSAGLVSSTPAFLSPSPRGPPVA